MILFSTSGCRIDERLGTQNELNDNSGNDENVDISPTNGGEIVVPILHMNSLNPLLSSDKSVFYFNKLIFEGLFEIDENMDIKSILVESYNFSDDGLILEIKLKDNVKWHDGEKFTSEDVKFTIDVLKYAMSDPNHFENLAEAFKASASLLQTINIEIVDAYNIRLMLKNKSADILENLTFPIISRHNFFVSNSYDVALSLENYNPIGTGPYRMDEYNNLKSVVLKANSEYWGDKPYIEVVTGKILKDYELSLTAFESGQIDVTTSQGFDWEKYAQNQNVKIYEYTSQQYEFLGFNFEKELFAGEKGKALRKAIAYGIDRQSIIQKVYLGHATQIDIPIHPNSWLVSNYSNSYGYNINKAKEILELAGWEDINGDGIYEDADGKNLSLSLSVNSYNDLRKRTADIIVENLRSIGIDVKKDYIEITPENITDEMLDTEWQEIQDKIKNGEFDVILLGWDLSYIPNLTFAFHSSQIENGSNFISYADEEMDSLLNKAIALDSRELKIQVYEDIQKKIVEELPYISLFFLNESVLLDKRINGEINPSYFNIYNNFDKWYILEQPEENEDTDEK